MSVPTNEQGHSGGYSMSLTPQARKVYSVESPPNWAPELRFPESVVIYEAMSYETHLSGILEAIAQPILNADWHLETEGVPEDVVKFVTTELGLTDADNPLSRIQHQGVVLLDHIEEMVETMLWAGFACAEIVYDTGPLTPAQTGITTAGVDGMVHHLRKLAPRPPRTITRIEVENDGGLKGIRQTPLDYELTQGIEDKFIGVDALVFYCHKRRGGHWAGSSVLRPAYRPWALKDIYLRLDAQAVDKHSSGYWKGTSSDKARAQELFDELAEMRNGDRGVVVTDPNDTVELLGLNGTLVDITPRLAYLDQEMSRSALAMFLDLGHDAGARSLGETFLQVFYTKVAAVARYIARIVTEHIIRDLVGHNFPSGTPYPSLSPGDVVAQQGASAETIKFLMDAGAIKADRRIEEYLRSRYGLPDIDEEERAEAERKEQEEADRLAAERERNLEVARATNPAVPANASDQAQADQALAASAQLSAMRHATAAYEALRARMGEPVGR